MRCVCSHWRGNDKSRDDEWVLLLLTFHRNFPPSRRFTALSCRQQHSHGARKLQNPTFIHNLFNPVWNSSGSEHPAFVDCIWQIRFYQARRSASQWLDWTDLPTPSKPWLGTGRGKSESNPLLKSGNGVPIHQGLSQSHEDAKTAPASWEWWEAFRLELRTHIYGLFWTD